MDTREPPIIDYDLIAPVYDTYDDEFEEVVLSGSPVFPSLHESSTTRTQERENDTSLRKVSSLCTSGKIELKTF